jgi:Ca2+-binding EF-hand superfamily protein
VKTNRLFAWTVGAVLLLGTMSGIMVASGQKASSSPSSAKLSLSALDTDQDGTVSKQEFLVYMEAQFDKADVDHDGTLDRNEFEQLRKNLGIAIKQ